MGSLRGAELIYWIFALAGTFFFLFRMAAMVVGGFGGESDGLDHVGDGGGVGEVSHGSEGATHSQTLDATDMAFKLVSLQSLTGFFMTFGWAGLSCEKQFGLGTTASFFISLAAGVVAMFITASLFKLMGRLNSSGDVFSVQKTIGLTGSVYTRIPSEGRGQVRLVLNNSTRFVSAVSEDRVDLDSFVNVTVVRVVDGSTVSVKKLP
ncbi:MAG: hypothetical protein JNK54_00695 [Elusimicrobia bacterium]|jgi:hypothetical protein|nr:hypothetical protein [Elusimicrobiota bacterium]